jgi:hypothetical protein
VIFDAGGGGLEFSSERIDVSSGVGLDIAGIEFGGWLWVEGCGVKERFGG